MADTDIVIDAEVDVEKPMVSGDANTDEEKDLLKDDDGNTDYDDDDEDGEVEILEYVDIVDEGYFTPTDIMILFLTCLILIVAAGVGVAIYFAYENQPDNDPTPSPIGAPVVPPTLPPSSGSFLCQICTNGSNITNPDAIVNITGRPTCGDLEDRGLAGEFTEGQCTLLRLTAEETCGCDIAVGCTVCENGGAVQFPDGVLDVSAAGFPGIDTLSCGQLDAFAKQGVIPDEYCSLLQNASGTICGCEPVTEIEGGTSCTVCAEGAVQNPKGVLDVSAVGLTGIETVTCGQLDAFAKQGQIPNEFCSLLQNASASECDCGTATVDVPCTVCAEGVIRNPEGVLDVSSAGFPGVDTLTCGQLDGFAKQGLIPTEFCTSLHQASLDTCDCGPELVETFVCPICNSSVEEIQNAETEVQLGNETLSCAELVTLAQAGGINASVCPSVQAAVSELCGCAVTEKALFGLLESVAGGGVNVEGRPENLAARYLLEEDPRFNGNQRRQLQPEESPYANVMNGVAQGDSPPLCTVCAEGKVRDPEGIVDVSAAGIPGMNNITCGELSDLAANDQIPPDLCPLLQEESVTPCDCGEVIDAVPVGVASPTGGQDSSPCPVCAEGEVQDPEGIVDVSAAGIPGMTNMTCRKLSNLAANGQIPADFCPLLQEASASSCDCGDVVVSFPEVGEDSPPCSVCAEGEVRDPKGIVDVSAAGITGLSNVSCGLLSNLAANGQIPPDLCPLLQEASATPCDCGVVTVDNKDGPLLGNGTETNGEGGGSTVQLVPLGDLSDEQIIQRYFIILLYIQTSNNRLSPWKSDCAPPVPERRELQQGSLKCAFVDGIKAQPWLGPAHECDWAGVECDESEEVVGLRLPGVGMTGRFPASILGLKSLEVVNFSHNALTGPLPAELTALAQLERLKLYANLLSGIIPRELADLENLKFFNLGKNQIIGAVPPQICNMPALKRLAVDCDEVKCDCCICCTDDGCGKQAVVL